MNRAALRSDIMSYADAQGSDKWDTTPGGLVDTRAGFVFDSIWREILNVNPQYFVGIRTPTSDATGRYQIADLTIGAGDSLQRFYRVLGVQIDGLPYDGPVPFGEWATQALNNPGTASRAWYQEGQAIVALPVQPNLAADAIWVNYLPQRPDQYESDDSTVIFPTGHEEVLIILSAARLLVMAGSETQASLELRADVQPYYAKMLADVSRVSTKPLAIQYNDSAREWGV